MRDVESPAQIDGKLVVLEQHPAAAALIKGALLAGSVLALLYFPHVFPAGVFGLHVFSLALFAWWWQTRQNFLARRRRRTVRFTPEGVFVDGVLTVRRDRIAAGHFQPRPPRDATSWQSYASSLRLLDSSGRLLFEAEMAEPQALEVLRLFGLDASSRRAEFSGSSPLYATTQRSALTSLATLVIGIVLTKFTGSIWFLYLMASLWGLGMWPSRIAVGVDGILLRWLWQKRFIPMSEVTRVKPSGDSEIQLTLGSGQVQSIWASMARKSGGDDAQRRDAVLARIEEARGAHRAGGRPADIAALVRRGSRSPRDWLGALKALRQEGGYRHGAVRDEDLWRVLEDPAAPEDARAGAAAALRSTLDEGARARVRIAAEATASPKLRVALDAVAGESDAAMATALHSFAEEGDSPNERDERAAS
jgi:hypothetical protein